MKRKYRLTLFSILALLIVCFIFGNSLQGGEASNMVSRDVATFLKPLLDPFERLSEEVFHFYIRKLAHFTEFAALGLCLTGVSLNMDWEGKRRWLAPVLATLVTAIADETIQRFTGRTSALNDVLIDLSGAVCGVLFVALVLWLWNKHRQKRGGEPSCPN